MNLTSEIIKNLTDSKVALTVPQLTKMSKITKYEQRVGIECRVLADIKIIKLRMKGSDIKACVSGYSIFLK